jgi:glycosyltransferase involved in cell wall biosynthesis
MTSPDPLPAAASVGGGTPAPPFRTFRSLSVLVPVYDEEGNIGPLVTRLVDVLEGLGLPFEIIMVNDGSRDTSLSVLTAHAEQYPYLKVVDLKRNYGQTAAMMCGVDHARGEVLVALDADLQNDPADIPALLAKLDEGFDVVSGWRRERKDARIARVLISALANRAISSISGVPLHDFGCTLKAYRRSVLDGVRLYGEMHRFIPIFASWMGARITEMPVHHHRRTHGHSKYGLGRILKVVLDLMVVKFLDRHLVKPIYVFGAFGLFSLLLSGLSFAYALYLKLAHNTSLIQTPLPLLCVMTFVTGIMLLLLGILSEIVVRTYFESQGKMPYAVRRRINFDQESR